MNPIKTMLSWVLFSISYVMILFLFFVVLPERTLWDVMRHFYQGFIDEPVWNDLYMVFALTCSVVLNAILIYSSLRLLNHFKK